jgi:hypothetical protein
MAALTVLAANRVTGGLVATATPTLTTGDTFPNTGFEMVYINNGSASPITITPHINATLDPTGQAAAGVDLAISVAAGVARIIGPFPPGTFNDATGNVKVTCSAVTTVTIAVFRLPPL